MSLDAQALVFLERLAALPPLDFGRVAAPELRAIFDQPGQFAAGDAAAEEDRQLPGAGGERALRLYRPLEAAEGSLPAVLYFHGGGFVTGNRDTHANICRCLAQRARALVVSVEYRLAPEHPFPAAVEDAEAALAALLGQAEAWGADPARVAVAGDSAGGNLAAVLARRAAGRGQRLCHQLLIYPVTDCRGEAYAELPGLLTPEMMRWYLRQYLPDTTQAAHPDASPLLADGAGLAAAARVPATLITAGYDILHAQGLAYGEALRAAGGRVEHRHWPGQIHGFVSMLGAMDAASEALDVAAGALRAAFAEAVETATERA